MIQLCVKLSSLLNHLPNVVKKKVVIFQGVLQNNIAFALRYLHFFLGQKEKETETT